MVFRQIFELTYCSVTFSSCCVNTTSLVCSLNNMTNSSLFCILVGWFYQRGRGVWTGTPPRLTEQPIIQIQCLATSTTRRVTEGNLPTTFGDTLKSDSHMCNCLLFSQADEARGAQKVPCEFMSTSKACRMHWYNVNAFENKSAEIYTHLTGSYKSFRRVSGPSYWIIKIKSCFDRSVLMWVAPAIVYWPQQ